MEKVLSKEELECLDGYFRAANYLSVAQIYLNSNPLLKKKLEIGDIKARLVGHFGSAPNQNFIYTHLNRIICKYNLDMFYISGPGHAGQALISCNYLDGTYSKFYPKITEDIVGMARLCKQFSFPYGVSSHAAPETPGSIHEGGELGYSLVHAYGAVLDNPNLIVACCIGDGEAETGTLATSWHLNKFLNRENDGIVLPILNLNGYKISNPTILGRMSDNDLTMMFNGMGYDTIIVSGDDKLEMHEKMASSLDYAIERIKLIKKDKTVLYKLPLIILRTPKGWTGPKEINHLMIEGSFRSHQVPFTIKTDEDLERLSNWLKSYKPEELFDKNGKLKAKYRLFVPKSGKRMGENIYTNAGLIYEKLKFPSIYKYNVTNDTASDMMELGNYLRDVVTLNPKSFRIFGPDEALSNRLNHVFEKTNRVWDMDILKTDEYLSNDGRVFDSFLSENVCEGLLEGYVLTGRNGIFHTYEAFSRTIDSMLSQYLKWTYQAGKVKWRKHNLGSLNIILTSHIWQQDHNGYTHQEPGLLNHLICKKKELLGMYLPMDANTLICTMDKCLKTKNKVNVIVASKHIREVYLNINEAIELVNKGIGILDFISDDNPDLVLIASGDTPVMEVVESVKIIKKYLNIKVRVITVVDLLKLDKEYSESIYDKELEELFTNKPSIFVFHGYPNLIYDVLRNRNIRTNVIGYKEEGAITTPFDMRVRNEIDRFHICLKASSLLKNIDTKELEQYCYDMLKKHKQYIKKYGKDMNIIKF